MRFQKSVKLAKIIIFFTFLRLSLTCKDENCKKCPDSAIICKECKQFFFLNATTQICDPCSSNCLKCLTENECLECNSGYSLVDYVGQTKKDSKKYCRINWLSVKFLSIVGGGIIGLFLLGFFSVGLLEDRRKPMMKTKWSKA